MEDVIDKDLPAVVNNFQDIQGKVNEVTDSIKTIAKKVEDGNIATSKGISFLEVKYHLLLSYLINLTHLMLQKASGNQIEGLVDTERLVEIRTVLEKIRPIDRKLKYQIDKAIKTAVTGSLDNDNPLRFKANPENLVSKFGQEGSESGSDEEAATSTKKYVPPKLASVHYDGDLTVKERMQMKLDKVQKKALSASIMQDLHEEYYHGPEEIANSAVVHSKKRKSDLQHQKNYEEDNFVRFTMTKQEKHAQRKVEMSSGLESITKFGNLGALSMTEADIEGGAGSKKRKRSLSKGKGKKKGGKIKKRRH